MPPALDDWPGIAVPRVLLPAPGVDLQRWAVVAADQYTSQRDYWQRVEERVGDAPSTLRLILPEVYLGDPDVEERIAKIHEAMDRYLEDGVLAPPVRGLVYVDRRTGHVPSRKGLLAALDLDRYDYREGSTTLVRASERTVEERLPPRVRIRRGSALELPHVMVLLDDPGGRVLEPLADAVRGTAPLYETELMEGGGSVRGWAIADQAALARVGEGLRALADPQAFREKYGVETDDVLLYAMGDGNHSLAAAKAHWEALKPGLTAQQRRTHPARHALVELVNVHDPGLVFEPIHRVVFGTDPERLLAAAPAHFEAHGSRAAVEPARDECDQRRRLESLRSAGEGHAVGFVTARGRGVIRIDRPRQNLAVGSLQTFLDVELSRADGASVDYIHGDSVVESLSAEPGRIGFFLPPMEKRELFETVIAEGVLPRKTFSMGEAEEKRFYLEARRIVP